MLVAAPRPLFLTTIVVTLIFPASILFSHRVGQTSGFVANPVSTLPTTLSQDSRICCNIHDDRNAGSFRRSDNQKMFRLRAQTDPVQSESEILKAEAEALKAEADKLRSEIEESASQGIGTIVNENVVASNEAKEPTTSLNPWAVVSSEPKEEGDQDFRLYVDIGREDGTWMEPRWGASGKRIDFSLDIRLLVNRLAAPENVDKMVKDNTMGKSSRVFALETARYARLRDGFDRMECTGGAYRIDVDKSGRSTIRMVVEVEGTTKADQSYIYGDVSVPPGCLYFSLPCFGTGINNLSIKDGVVSVRQIGWHTGWRREESRIAGVFNAKPLPDAKSRDGF
mmetsp:Transcript_17107/g.39432  ORF Transcript_17107/g.39432 Transcript_17107/m.39432 type:complete len:339 (-) Transcript_17107:718-1734(-)